VLNYKIFKRYLAASNLFCLPKPSILITPQNLAINCAQNSSRPGKLRFIAKMGGLVVGCQSKYIIISINSEGSI
jgi:hypothetical protein